MKRAELLSPAGTLRSMRYAFAYGADAVYAGQPRYSLRVRNNEFDNENLACGIAEAHALGKLFFLTVNVMPHNNKVKTFIRDLEPLIELKPDGLIMSDPGLIMMVRERWPEVDIHLSVQANTVNYMSVRFWQSVGVRRIILSRELGLEEIAEIRALCPEMELETFVHGALCIAYSGRCLLSGYFNHRDPNQGACTNACRWQYKTLEAAETPDDTVVPAEQVISLEALNQTRPFATVGNQERHPLADRTYLLEEAGRPGDYMPISEDEHGTYIMNSKDLRAIEHVPRLCEIGIDCLKIEGRTKSHYYVARTAQTYRQAIDDAVAGRPFNDKLIGVLENLASRGYTTGFYQRHHSQSYQNYLQGVSKSHQQQFVGEIRDYDEAQGVAEIEVKNRFSVGDRLELISPQGNADLTLEAMIDKNGNAIECAKGSGHVVRIPLPVKPSELSMLARYY